MAGNSRKSYNMFKFEWFLHKLELHNKPWDFNKLKEYINRFERKV